MAISANSRIRERGTLATELETAGILAILSLPRPKLTDESVCPTLVRKPCDLVGQAGAFACQPFFHGPIPKAAL
jgi:hypothetical protein